MNFKLIAAITLIAAIPADVYAHGDQGSSGARSAPPNDPPVRQMGNRQADDRETQGQPKRQPCLAAGKRREVLIACFVQQAARGVVAGCLTDRAIPPEKWRLCNTGQNRQFPMTASRQQRVGHVIGRIDWHIGLARRPISGNAPRRSAPPPATASLRRQMPIVVRRKCRQQQRSHNWPPR